MKVRKIAYITGSRADFGLMTSVLTALEKSPYFDLQIYATGMHLMPEFWFSFNEVKKVFPKTKKIAVQFSDDHNTMANFVAGFVPPLTKVLQRDKPDIVLVQGDRVEMLAVALVSNYLGLPLAHTHGGDKTTTIDDTARHAITKLSHIHFAATNDSLNRIKKLGEEQWRIHVVGAPSLDTILNQKLPNKPTVHNALTLPVNQKFILILQHPVTNQIEQAARHMEMTITAAKQLDLPIVIIYPNADAGGRQMIKIIEREKKNPKARLFPNVAYSLFLAIAREAAVWIGNSSAGIIESASFHTPVVNIGDRQNGRPDSGNVIHVAHEEKQIVTAIKKSLFDKQYLGKISKVKNIWGDGKAAARIVKIFQNIEIDRKLLHKQITY